MYERFFMGGAMVIPEQILMCVWDERISSVCKTQVLNITFFFFNSPSENLIRGY